MDTYTPATVARLFNDAEAARRANALRTRRAACHRMGYHGPLTRTELASQAGR